ncbi:MAG: DMT family transporter [Anaerolineales bacterium]|nr:DMT family transporter [Anaerolineales bacterium]
MNEPSRRPFMPPLLVIVFGILAVSTGSIFVRYAQVYAPSIVIAAYRLGLATLFLAPIALIRHRAELANIKGRDRWLAIGSGIFLALHFATWISSLEYTTVVSSVVLVSTAPLWVALLSPITVKEPLTKVILIGMSLALVGVFVVGLSDICSIESGKLVCPSIGDFIRGSAFLGDLLALAGAWMAAGYLLIGRRLRGGIALIPYIFVVYGVAAAVLIILMIGSGQSPVGYPIQTYVWLILLALVPQLMGHSSFNWALGFLSAAFVSITLLGEPIGSAVLAYILLDETPTFLKIIGAILILAGIYIASRGETRQRPNPS